MRGYVCPTCGCSLIRLGISIDRAPSKVVDGRELYFCCKECMDMFLRDPSRYLAEWKDIFVCPVCLAEKPKSMGVKFEWEGEEILFCRCPHCREEFRRKPDYYLRRLEGKEPYEGVFGKDFCCG